MFTYFNCDFSAQYHNAATIGSIPAISKRTGVFVDGWSYHETQAGKSSSDRGASVGKTRMRRELHKGKDVDTYEAMYDALTSEPKLRGVTVVLATMDYTTVQPGWQLDKIRDYGYFQFNEDDTMTVWKYYGIGEGLVVTGMTEIKGDMGIVIKGGRQKADKTLVADERFNIDQDIPCSFWINDVKDKVLAEEEETGDVDDDVAKEKKRDVLHYCWCGSRFIRFKNLLNHLEWGRHKICPEKTRMIDMGIGLFKRTVEDFPTASLLPLQDAVDGATDQTVGIPPEGFALRSAKRGGGSLPEEARKMAVDYFWNMRKTAKKPNPNQAFNMINESNIPPEKRLTFEQIRSLFGRMWKLPLPTSRARRSGTQEGEGEELGEWEPEYGEMCEPDEDVGYDDFVDRLVHSPKIKPTLFNSKTTKAQ